jgi:transposase
MRMSMVLHARTHGIRDAARAFACARNTVRLWLRRFQEGGRAALRERSRAPKTCPHKTSPAQERRVLEARDRAPCLGPHRLRDLFGLRPSEGAIARILRQSGRTKRPRKKHEKKNDLREIKKRYRPFERLQADNKPLFDIPYYWTQMMDLGLPRHQYTHRDVKTGALFIDYADERTASHALISTRRVLGRLRRHGVDLGDKVLSTDNGSEYGGTDKRQRDRGYHAAVGGEGIAHRFLPPATPKAHADVESSHARIEAELFDLENFASRADFFEKVCAYQRWWNFARPNCSKGDKTPAELLAEEGIDPSVLLLVPDDLDAHIRHDPRGHHMGQYLPVDTRTRGLQS